MPRPSRLLCYFGHHKSASTWVHNILGNVCDEAGWRCGYLANEGMFGRDLPGWLAHHPTEVLCYVNADWSHVQRLPPGWLGFHLIRDPRDILTSAYFSHLHSHRTEAWPALVEHRARLRQVSKEEGLLLELDFNADVLEHLSTWPYGRPDVLELRTEELTADPLNGWLEIFRFLGIVDEHHVGRGRAFSTLLATSLNVLHHHGRLPFGRPLAQLPAERLLGIVHDNRFEAKTAGRAAGEEDSTSHWRKGVPGDWRNHWTAAHVAAFKQRHPGLLARLGYEDGDDWDL